MRRLLDRFVLACVGVLLSVGLAAAAAPHDFVVAGGSSPGAPGDPGAGQGPCNNGSGGDPSGNGDADPVDLFRGEFLLERADVFLAGRGPSIDVRFHYRSRSAFNGPYGYGWDMSYARRVRRLSNGELIVLTGNNHKTRYAPAGGGAYTSSDGTYGVLVAETDGTYTLAKKHGGRERFDVNGNLSSVEDRHGNALIFEYDAAGKLPVVGPSDYFAVQTTGVILREYRLTRIVDANGRSAEFEYDALGRLASIEYVGRTVSYAYDAQGNLTSVTAPATPQFPAGTTTSYAYSAHNLTSITDAKGQTYLTNVYTAATDRIASQVFGGSTTTFAYGSDGGGNAFTDVIDRNGNHARYTFDGAGHVTRLEQFTDGIPAGEPPVYVTTREYDAAGQLRREVLPRGNATEFTYSARGELTQWRRKTIGATAFVDDAADIVTSVTYEPAFDMVKSITDPRGGTTVLTYDYELGEAAQGRVRRVTYPTVGATTPVAQLTYNAFGQLETFTDPNGQVLKRTYDSASGLLLESTAGFGTTSAATTAFTYDAAGNIATRRDPNGHVTGFQFDAQDRLTRVVGASPFGFEIRYRHDANGNLVQVDQQSSESAPGAQPPLGTFAAGDDWRSILFSYSTRDELTSVRDELGNVKNFTYDGNGNQTSVQDAAGFTTGFVFDERDQLRLIVDAALPAGNVDFAYDANGNLRSIRDPHAGLTTFAYDDFDRKTRATFADGSFEQLAYDKASNVVSRVTPAGATLSYVFDALGRLSSKTQPGETTTYGYDAASRLVSAADADATLSFAYDVLDRPIASTTTLTGLPGSRTIQYGYDRRGNRTSLEYPDGLRLVNKYDALHRLRSIGLPRLGPHAAPAPGGTIEIQPAPLPLARFTYDALGRRSKLDRPGGVQTYYAYDAEDRVTQVAHTSSSGAPIETFTYGYDVRGNRTSSADSLGVATFAYDRLAQLVGADLPPGLPFADSSETYDPAGNRTSHTQGSSTSYVVNALNQYTSVGAASALYDANGNLASLGVSTFSYDAENRLVGATTATSSLSFGYDPLGRRVRQTVDGVTTYLVYDGDDELAEYDGSGALISRFIHGSEIDEPLFLDRATQRYTYVADGLGSIQRIVDGGAATVERYRYDAFGGTAIEDGGGAPLSGSAIGNRHAFTGREYFAGAALYDYRARAYRPDLGRFLQRDPLSFLFDVNPYRFVGNNPLSFFDPFGLSKGVGQPGFAESLIPIWGSGRAAVDDFQNGRWGWGLFNSALAVSDVFLVKSLVTAAGKALGKGAVEVAASAGRTSVYSSVENGVTKYVGITDDFATRSATHLRQRGLSVLELPGLTGLSRADARAVEQVLIEHHGLGKNGGSLLNKINSIARDNPIYDAAVQRGRDLLRQAGYPGFADPAIDPALLAWLGARELLGGAAGACE